MEAGDLNQLYTMVTRNIFRVETRCILATTRVWPLQAMGGVEIQSLQYFPCKFFLQSKIVSLFPSLSDTLACEIRISEIFEPFFAIVPCRREPARLFYTFPIFIFRRWKVLKSWRQVQSSISIWSSLHNFFPMKLSHSTCVYLFAWVCVRVYFVQDV